MADLLGSIMGQMEKPPTIGSEERKKAKEQRLRVEKLQQQEKDRLKQFRTKMHTIMTDFIKDNKREKCQFDPMDKVYRGILHEVADIAGLASFSFGVDEVDRYVMLWKKEHAPTDDELTALRNGEVWDPEAAKLAAQQKQTDADVKHAEKPIKPQSNYQDKYQRLIGTTAAKDAAKITTANASYGFVTSENKRDRRTIEQVMADSQAKKKLKTQHSNSPNTQS
jgi:hypothetical protein